LEWPEFPPDAPAVVVEDGDLVFPDDTHEIFSYAAEARSKALGAQTELTYFSDFDIQSSPLNYDENHYSHSRQFRSNIIDEKTYWSFVHECLSLSE